MVGVQVARFRIENRPVKLSREQLKHVMVTFLTELGTRHQESMGSSQIYPQEDMATHRFEEGNQKGGVRGEHETKGEKLEQGKEVGLGS